MKKIEAVIDPELLSRVMSALHALPHFPGVTVNDAQGQGRGEGPGGKYIPHGPSWAFAKKTKLEIICTDSDADQLVKAIRGAAPPGQTAHGIVYVSAIETVVRPRTGEEQDRAL